MSTVNSPKRTCIALTKPGISRDSPRTLGHWALMLVQTPARLPADGLVGNAGGIRASVVAVAELIRPDYGYSDARTQERSAGEERMTLPRTLPCSLVLCAWSALFPSSAPAQSQNAAIAGVVKDAAGAVLPGVTVEASSPALIEKTRTTVTDRQGAYKIVELRPGAYTVTFTLTGFSTVLREGLELPSSFTATINADMRMGAVEETVTVSGEGPIVDTQNVANTAVTSRQVMDALPTDRNFTSLASTTPGMQVVGQLQNVGGSDPETRLMLRTHGSRIGESRLFVDGMSVMSGNGTGGVNFGNYLNNAMAQELVVNTDSMSAEFELSGVTSNFITRSGSNTVHGSFSGRYANTALQSTELSGRSRRSRAVERQPDQEDLGREPIRGGTAPQGSRVAVLLGSALGHLQLHRRTLRRSGPHGPVLYARSEQSGHPPRVARQRRRAAHLPGDAQEQGQRLLPLSVHRFRHLPRSLAADCALGVRSQQE